MIPRLLILIGLVLAGCAALFYLVSRVHRFRFSLALARGRRGWSWVISALAVLLPSAAIWLAWGYMNAIICLLHLALFWLLSDALFALLKRLHGKPWRRYYAGLTALLLTAAYLSAGWVQAHHVWQTNYIIHTDKPVGTLRIALLADSHMGTTFHADGFARELDRIAAQKPDLLVIAGDFVDEDTEKEDMLAACRALGQLDMPVYYVFGNHDKGLYDSKCTRGFTGDDLAAELTANGVHVLEDEIVPIGDAFWLIGRQDASEELGLGGGRASMAELTRGWIRRATPSCWTISRMTMMPRRPRASISCSPATPTAGSSSPLCSSSAGSTCMATTPSTDRSGAGIRTFSSRPAFRTGPSCSRPAAGRNM